MESPFGWVTFFPIPSLVDLRRNLSRLDFTFFPNKLAILLSFAIIYRRRHVQLLKQQANGPLALLSMVFIMATRNTGGSFFRNAYEFYSGSGYWNQFISKETAARKSPILSLLRLLRFQVWKQQHK